jgi:hypothetical protein
MLRKHDERMWDMALLPVFCVAWHADVDMRGVDVDVEDEPSDTEMGNFVPETVIPILRTLLAQDSGAMEICNSDGSCFFEL